MITEVILVRSTEIACCLPVLRTSCPLIIPSPASLVTRKLVKSCSLSQRERGSVAAAPDTWALHELALSLQEGRLWQLEDKPFTVNSLSSYLPTFLTSKLYPDKLPDIFYNFSSIRMIFTRLIL